MDRITVSDKVKVGGRVRVMDRVRFRISIRIYNVRNKCRCVVNVIIIHPASVYLSVVFIITLAPTLTLLNNPINR